MEQKPEQNKKIEQPINSDIEAGPSQQDKLFFNVMPRTGGESLVQPEIKIQAGAANNAPPERRSAWQVIFKYKKYILLAAAAIILSLAVYFIANYIGQHSYQAENLLNQNAPAANKVKARQATTTPVSGFTTPQTWRDKYFAAGCTDVNSCGDNADPDHDGLTNLEEYQLGTDPNNPDSGGDGLADGDKVHIFGISPLKSHNGVDPSFTDAQYVIGGYDFTTNKKLTAQQIADLRQKMQTFGLHEPSITTVGQALNIVYGFTPAQASSTPASAGAPPPAAGSSATSTIVAGVDESAAAKQERDAQRSDTILNIEVALVKYYSSNGSKYPADQDFNSMISDIKPYLKVATHTTDPLNSPPFVYSYVANAAASDFDLSFYSETQNQIITKNAADAQADAAKEQADIYDNQRESDLQSLRVDLLLYSNDNVAGNQSYVFPTVAKFKTALVPKYANQIPVDPKTGKDYDYEASGNFGTFTLKTLLDDPPAGTTGYVCNQDSCQNY